MKYRRRYKPRRPPPFNPVKWLFKSLWRRIFSPIPPLKPGELPTRIHTDAFYDSIRWEWLAYRTKCRYGWVCMNPACRRRWPEVRIVADHIKSVRYHWHLRLDPSNMQVLCNDCNLAKGSNDFTDYRSRLQRNHPRWWLRWAFSQLREKRQ